MRRRRATYAKRRTHSNFGAKRRGAEKKKAKKDWRDKKVNNLDISKEDNLEFDADAADWQIWISDKRQEDWLYQLLKEKAPRARNYLAYVIFFSAIAVVCLIGWESFGMGYKLYVCL
jgi:hypothetical protein